MVSYYRYNPNWMHYKCPAYYWLKKNILEQQYNKFCILSYSFEDTNECLLTSKTMEGPYYLENSFVRKDIREDRKGINLILRLKIVDVKGCRPIPDAVVDIWHCDALGHYSGYTGVLPSIVDDFEQSSHVAPINDDTFLRGRQYSNENGMVEFLTIYPGWYKLRTVHIHIKIFINSKEQLTTQLFFPQELSYKIQSLAPYNTRPLSPYVNENDFVLRESHGVQGGWPKISKIGETYIATLTIGIDLH